MSSDHLGSARSFGGVQLHVLQFRFIWSAFSGTLSLANCSLGLSMAFLTYKDLQIYGGRSSYSQDAYCEFLSHLRGSFIWQERTGGRWNWHSANPLSPTAGPRLQLSM
ncbi:hypothetical protein AKJ16_DCAP06543 [Drosera capensis]